MADSKPFTLYPRKIGKRKVFYVRYRMPDGTRLAGRSTGQTSRAAAERYAWEHLRSNRVVRKDVTLADFAGDDFFSWESQWATDRRARGRRLSERTCLEKTNKLKRHILPILGGYKIVAINKAAIAELRATLFRDGLSADTINKTLDCLKAILEAAEDSELLGAVPKIERASGAPRKRGILTNDEVQALFGKRWPDERAFVCNALAASSGLRLGECLALTDDKLRPDSVTVSASYDSRTRELSHTTKTGESRIVPVPASVMRNLRRLLDLNPHRSTPRFVFWAERSAHKPMDAKCVQRELYRALSSIGITESERCERKISFHSHRHWFNSMLIEARIPAEKVRKVTGHASVSMTMNYYHTDEMTDVRSVQAIHFEKDRAGG